MYLVTWIEGEEVNYRLVNQKELQPLLASVRTTCDDPATSALRAP